MAAEVDQRNGEVGKFDEVSTHQVLPQGFGDSSMVREAFESRVSTMKEIMEALIDPAVHLIGLYGLGGVGKTTLAKQVAEKAQDETLFDRVLVVEVKHNPINEIQNQIADMVGFHFDAQSENRRADELRQRLEQEKSLLIVLDDLWERLDFKQVGIPSADEPNTQRKFIFTSRNASLLSSQMNCKRNILVELLSEEEAWVLFKEMAEINEHSDDPDLVSKATEISQKCARLPVAIVAVARALRNNKSLGYWKDALQRLKSYSSRNNSITKEVDSSIRLSYDFLENKELKSTFLLSAMFSQDPLIMDLFMYAVGLGFLDDEDVHDMEGARNRLEALVHELKASSLLLDSYSKDRFTIHDVVRDVALSIAFEVQHALVKRRAKVDKWPNDERLEKCIIICLDRSDINELPEDLYGPKVEFFYLYNKDRKLSMPSNFFRRMQELKVLSLSDMTFSFLPSSISLLQKLITLSFHSCTLEDISVVGNLKNLKILNLSSSRIEELPCEVGQLSSLKILNLSRCHQLKVIPPNLLSSLNKLEELYMGGSFNLWKANGLNDGKDNASLDELKNLQKLSALEIDIPNASVLPKDLFLEILLERYKISIGGCCYDYYSYEFSRTLRLAANSNINMEYGVFRLFESVEDLYLQNLNGIASLHQSHITAQTFRKLRAIKVSRCDQLKSLFLDSMAGTLSKLETIEVSECMSLEEIVAFSDEENVVKGSTMNVIEFLQLRSLKLKDLPALVDFCFNKKVTFPNLETLYLTSINCQSIWDIFMPKSSETQMSEIVESSQIRIVSEDALPNRSFSKLKTLVVVHCKRLENIFPLSIAKGLIQLEELQILDCGIEVVVAKDEFPLEPDTTFVLPKLRKLEIKNCTKYSLFSDEKVISKLEELSLIGMHAKMMWNGEFRGFCFLNVKFLSLSNIYEKTRTFPYSLFHGFPNLEQLQLRSTSCEVIFSFSERSLDNDAQETISIKGLKLVSMSWLKHIWDGKCQVDHILQNLETLYVNSCHRLINLGSSFVSLQNLIDLDVSNCDKLINLLSPSTARTLVQLTRLKIKRCKKIEEIITDEEEDEEKDIVFMKLKILELDELSSCKSFCCHGYNFKFPFLDEVIIRGCPRFRMFCSGNLTTPLLKGVKVVDKKIHWQSNLNKTIQQLFDQKVLFTGGDVKIDEYPELIDIWNEKCAVSNLYFSNLTSLIMDKCAFLSNYLIPSHVLISLINLKQLKVSDCESVEVVFDLEGIDIDKEAHTLQAIPLWRLELRHLPNLKCVWNKDPHTVHCFQNLDFMSAYECENLRSIFPASIAEGLINLSSLKIESCGVEVIVAEDHTPSPTIHFVFPQLFSLYLVKLSNLKNFYPQRHTVEWPRLKYMDVRQCKKVKVFSWEDPKITEKETEEGVENQYPLFLFKKVTFPKLETLRLASIPCQSIWDICISKSSEIQIPEIVESSQIKVVSKDQLPDGSFSNLKTLVVVDCKFLLKLIPLYILKSLSHLEQLEISGCDLLEEVFNFGRFNNYGEAHTSRLKRLILKSLSKLKTVWGRGSKGIVNFSSLQQINVRECRSLESVFPASIAKGLIQLEELQISDCGIEVVVAEDEFPLEADVIFVFPEFRKLEIKNCNKLKIFQSELPDAKYSLCLDEKVIPKLEKLSLIGMHATMMWNVEFRDFNFLNVKSLSLSEIYDETGTFPYRLFHGFPNLEQLQLCNAFFKVIFSCSERPLDNDAGKTISIKGLKLFTMKRLKHIWDGKCQVDHILQNLETLCVDSCHRLINLGSSFVSLQNLTNLNVSNCDKLINLLSPSTARTLVQLIRLKIKRCKKIEEIITDGEEDEEKDIVFMKLKILEFDGLTSCQSFCCHSYNFKFPLLDEVIIRGCPRFRMFCPGNLTIPLLKGVKVEDEKIHWQSNLNEIIQQLFDKKVLFTGLDVKIDEYPKLIDIWNGKCAVSNFSFNNLTSLIMDKCAFLSNYVIPSYVLISLINLENLEVRNCKSVEVVFDLKGIDIDKEARALRAICLQRLELRNLPNLKCVWNKDPHTVHCFQYLQFMSAYECESLRSIFPASIAKGLIRLQDLRIKSCGVEVIIAEDHTPSPTIHFVFPELRRLHVIKLSNLKNFYPQRHTIEWPRLKHMDVRQCKKVKVFSWEDSKITEKETEDGVENQYPFFLFKKVFSKLYQLVLNEDHVKMIRNDQFQYDLFNEVSTLGLDSFNEDKSLVFPYAILEKFPKLKYLKVSHSSFKDIFVYHGPPSDPSRKLPLLTSLSLTHLDQLQNIWNKDSNTCPIFQSLKSLDIKHCHHLGYLLTTSTTKGLVHLETLRIKDCEKMEEIVTNEGKALEDIIGLKKLNAMKLIDLPVLKNFCSQACTFEFPSLTDVTIRGCSKMKMFCLGVLVTPLLEDVQVEEDKERWEGNLNKTIEQLFLEKEGLNSLEG